MLTKYQTWMKTHNFRIFALNAFNNFLIISLVPSKLLGAVAKCDTSPNRKYKTWMKIFNSNFISLLIFLLKLSSNAMRFGKGKHSSLFCPTVNDVEKYHCDPILGYAPSLIRKC